MDSRSKGLTSIVGVTAAALLLTIVPDFEGTRYKAYRDIAGVWTICQGDTKDVRPEMVETKEGCEKRLISQLEARAPKVLACTPGLKDKPYALAAAISLTYNIGVPAYCKSTVSVKFNQGDMPGGCDAFLPWNKARVDGKLRVVSGLVTRRQKERAICLT